MGVVLWAGVTAVAFGHFWKIAATPGQAAAAAPDRVQVVEDRALVLAFLDWRCPCSRATVAELGRVAARLDRPTEFRVFFATTDPKDHAWASSFIGKEVSRLPGVTIVPDVHGAQARQFGITTSGQILAYRPDGRLAFAGGITGSRGHEGDNAGKSQLIHVLNSTDAPDVGLSAESAAVYGCTLPTFTSASSKELQ